MEHLYSLLHFRWTRQVSFAADHRTCTCATHTGYNSTSACALFLIITQQPSPLITVSIMENLWCLSLSSVSSSLSTLSRLFSYWPSSSHIAAFSLRLKLPCVCMSDTTRGHPWRPPRRGSDRAKLGGGGGVGGWKEAELLALKPDGTERIA